MRNLEKKLKESLAKRAAIAREVQREFPQNRRGGYDNIASEQYDRSRYTSAEPSPETFAKIKKLADDDLQVE